MAVNGGRDNGGRDPQITQITQMIEPGPDRLSDVGRRNLRRVMEAIGCFQCPALEVIHGRNANDYGCLRGGCDRQRAALAIIKAHQKSTPSTPSTESTESTGAQAH